MEINPNRYQKMKYRYCGKSGLRLSALSLGMWHNFGDAADMSNMEAMVYTAFNSGITHFDLANNYGPDNGAAEINFGKILKNGFDRYRDEIIISTKAGYPMWEGPYGDGGSRKYLMASINQSLQRLGVEYVDIFYHHRPDPNTPLLETLKTLDDIVRQGKALYIGLSKYTNDQLIEAIHLFKLWNTPFIIIQPTYSLLNQHIVKDGTLDLARYHGFGVIPFSPLAQGLLTARYLHGVPADSRAASGSRFLKEQQVGATEVELAQKLNVVAQQRKQSISQMALSWVLRDEVITSVIIGASRPQQILENVECLNNLEFSVEELEQLDQIINEYRANPLASYVK